MKKLSNVSPPTKITVFSTPLGPNPFYDMFVTSGSANPLNIDQKDRRFIIIDEVCTPPPDVWTKLENSNAKDQ